jgi:hypothetical protein
MERTKYPYIGKSDQQMGIHQPLVEIPQDPHNPVIDLPKPAALEIEPLDLRYAIEHRRSIRSYLYAPITIGELSFLLWCTQGVQQVHGRQATFRTVPSAGARHAFETFLLVNNVSGLEPGL